MPPEIFYLNFYYFLFLIYLIFISYFYYYWKCFFLFLFFLMVFFVSWLYQRPGCARLAHRWWTLPSLHLDHCCLPAANLVLLPPRMTGWAQQCLGGWRRTSPTGSWWPVAAQGPMGATEALWWPHWYLQTSNTAASTATCLFSKPFFIVDLNRQRRIWAHTKVRANIRVSFFCFCLTQCVRAHTQHPPAHSLTHMWHMQSPTGKFKCQMEQCRHP